LSTTEEIKAAVIKKAQEMATERDLLAQSDEYIKLTQGERIQKIERLETKKAGIDNEIAQIRMEIDKADPENTKIVEETENRIQRLEKGCKRLRHSIPIEDLAERGIKIVDNEDSPTVSITVSKVQTSSTFDTEALLEEFPDLLEASIEGDQVVIRSIDAAVLERLVEEGDISKDVLKHRVVVKTRNPSVRITP